MGQNASFLEDPKEPLDEFYLALVTYVCTCIRASMQVLRHSAMYETAPAYMTDQPSYLNAAVLTRTDMPPLELLQVSLRSHDRDAVIGNMYTGTIHAQYSLNKRRDNE